MQYDVYGLGNAIVDYEIEISDQFLEENKVEKGLMTLVDEERQAELLNAMGNKITKRQAGGSGANSIFAISQFGGKAYYACRVANDEDGRMILGEYQENGIGSNLTIPTLTDGITGKCLVMITDDSERTMNTFLGITSNFSPEELDPEAIKQSKYLFIEGYLISSDSGRVAMKKAKEIAEANGVKTSLTFSDPAMVKYFGEPMKEVVGDGLDLLFCNEEEAQIYTGAETLEAALEALKEIAKTFVVTKGKEGALVYDGSNFIEIAPNTITAVDATGAGDMFSGAFLYGITNGLSFEKSGKLASLAAAKVVAQFGPRMTNEEMKEILKSI